MAPLKATHFFIKFRSLGGVEAVLQHHYARDAHWGLASRFIIYFEAETEPMARVQYLDLDRRVTIQGTRRRFGAAIQAGPPEVAVYHDMWGMPYMSDLDQAARRIVLLHGQTPGMLAKLSVRGKWLDGVVCVNEALRQMARPCLPHLGEDRIAVLPYPITPPSIARPERPLGKRPLVLGFCGRLQVEQKRVDRLSVLCQQLAAHGIDYRLEFLGDGPARAWLERQHAARGQFHFHGRKSGEEYWRILSGWDVIVFTSDYEGTPISLLEALSVGVIPIYPRIGSGGDGYVGSVRRDLLYEPDDFAHAANTLAGLGRTAEAEWQSLRRRCFEAAAPHLGDAYLKPFANFVHQVRNWPKVSQAAFPRRPPLVDYLPFSWLERIGIIRRFVGRRLRPSRAAAALKA